MKNIEIKYRIHSLPGIIRFLNPRNDIDFQWEKKQIDIYFNCHTGRLKLRKTDDGIGELIFYQRPDQKRSRDSQYEIFRTNDPAELEKILSKSNGQKVVVDKNRHLYLYKNVRIHLDEVKHLGSFLEFESVLAADLSEAVARENLAYVQTELHQYLGDIIPGSYSDLLLELQEKKG